MRFPNRAAAAKWLAERLETWRRDRPLVLGVPRAGVLLARDVAHALRTDLDVVLVHRLSLPGEARRTCGAVAETGVVLRDDPVDPMFDAALTREIERQRRVLHVRDHAYRDGSTPPSARGRTVVIVDDGLVTGSSMLAAIEAVRRRAPARVVVAVAVAASDALARVQRAADAVICLHDVAAPLRIRHFFEDFPPVDDDEVVTLLEQWRRDETRQRRID